MNNTINSFEKPFESSMILEICRQMVECFIVIHIIRPTSNENDNIKIPTPNIFELFPTTVFSFGHSVIYILTRQYEIVRCSYAFWREKEEEKKNEKEINMCGITRTKPCYNTVFICIMCVLFLSDSNILPGFNVYRMPLWMPILVSSLFDVMWEKKQRRNKNWTKDMVFNRNIDRVH